MKPINLFVQTRIEDKECFDIMARHSLSNNDSDARPHEIKSMRIFVDQLIKNGVSIEALDGFFVGFKIKQIGKELDLLKILDSRLLNVELKSKIVSQEEIHKQLVRNKYYLSHLGKEAEFFTVNTEDLSAYKLDDEGNLQVAEFKEIVNELTTFCTNNYLTDIDSLFKVSDYLISPLNTPEKFINGEYFLTQQQEAIRADIIKKISENDGGFFSISGKAGTGKTLLLYDIAKELRKQGRVLIIHCGKLASGQVTINKNLSNVVIVSVADMRGPLDLLTTYNYEYVLVDETHRIYYPQFDTICSYIKEKNKIGIFSSDQNQTLSLSEEHRKIVEQIFSLPLIEKYELSEKIRTNKELASFIMSIRNLKHRPQVPMSYKNVTLAYANSVNEAECLIKYFKQRGYVFINYSKSNRKYSPYSKYDEDFDTHHVIGQEFDNVLMLMDEAFYYDEDGILCAKTHPNPDYLYEKLFYQGITRVREKIALVIIDNITLFKQIVSIFKR